MKCFNCGKAKADVREYAMQDANVDFLAMTLHPFCLQCRRFEDLPRGIHGIIDRVCPWDFVQVSRVARMERFFKRGVLTAQLIEGLDTYECPGTVYEVDGWRVLTRVKLFPTDKAYKAHYEWHWWEPEDYLFLRRGWLHEEEMQCQGQRKKTSAA